MIDITTVDLRKFVQEVYALSKPVGMGFLHFRDVPLSDEDAQGIIDRERGHSRIAASMDYVHGRQCKMTVYRKPEGGGLEINDRWYDHSDAQLDELLSRVGINRR